MGKRLEIWCDLCGIRETDKVNGVPVTTRLFGIRWRGDGSIYLDRPEHTDLHICETCIVGLSKCCESLKAPITTNDVCCSEKGCGVAHGS